MRARHPGTGADQRAAHELPAPAPDGREAQAILTHIARLPIDTDRHAVPRQELLALPLRFGSSSYDAAYLELALRRQLPVATQDKALRAAALAAGVGCVEAAV